jgi:transcriptional regulator with XRE-family HTH domain
LKGDSEVELSKQIKELRARDGLSQEALAERIYVTRQTVSNWETERSYPDVQSLLMLSVLFNISLDELVKGDIEMMKSELDKYKMNMWTWIMLACIIAMFLSIIPLVAIFDWPGLVVSVILAVVSLIAGFKVEGIKKKHNLVTFSEILAFTETAETVKKYSSWAEAHPKMSKILGMGRDGTPDMKRAAWTREHPTLLFALKMLVSAVAGLIFGVVVMLVWGLIFGGFA